MDDAEARRWLAQLLNGVDALTDDLVLEGARLLADAMDSNRLVGEAKPESLSNAVDRSRERNAYWDEFKLRHALTSRPDPALRKDR